MSTDHKPTIIKSFPGQAVEDFRRRHGGKLPGEDKTADDLEQARVQLAGCLVAAEGGTNEEHTAKPGDYGYSLAYEKTLLLRRAFDHCAGGMSPEDVLAKLTRA